MQHEVLRKGCHGCTIALLQVKAAYALAAGPTQVAVACAHGVVRLFSCKSLAFRATLPRIVARSQGAAAETGEPCSACPASGRSLCSGCTTLDLTSCHAK
jgi:hypothetical protein